MHFIWRLSCAVQQLIRYIGSFSVSILSNPHHHTRYIARLSRPALSALFSLLTYSCCSGWHSFSSCDVLVCAIRFHSPKSHRKVDSFVSFMSLSIHKLVNVRTETDERFILTQCSAIATVKQTIRCGWWRWLLLCFFSHAMRLERWKKIQTKKPLEFLICIASVY